MATSGFGRIHINLAVLVAVVLFIAGGLAASRGVILTSVSAASGGEATPSRGAAPAIVEPRIAGKPLGSSSLPGEIVYGSGGGGGYNLHSITNIGGNNDMGYLGPTNDWHPVFSPDGGTIVFTSFRDAESGSGYQEIYTMTPDGYNQRRLTTTGCHDADYSYSRDGTKIVYVCDGVASTMNADGSGQTVIADLNDYIRSPTFSPDGTKILFMYNGTIWRMDANGANPAEFVESVYTDRARYSPDGTKILYSNSDEVWTVNADGTNQNKIIDNENVGYLLDEPQYSPDGTKILMICSNGPRNVCTANADGSDFAPLLGNVFEREDPVWSPDSTQVAFIARQNSPSRYQIYSAPIGGTPELLIQEDPNGSILRWLAWQPSCAVAPTPTPTPSVTPTPASGLISEWNANNLNADDSAGNNHGTFIGDAALINPGKVGYGFVFFDNGGRIEVADDDTLDVQTGDYTLSTWFYPVESAEHYVAGKGACGDNSSNFYIGVETDFVPFIDIANASGGGSRVSNGAFVLTPTVWHHLLLRKQGSNFKLFVDGVEALSHDDTQPMNTGSQPFTIGQGDQCTAPQLTTKGGVDEVRLYGRALTTTEITAIYEGSALTATQRPKVCTPPVEPALKLRLDYPHPVAAGRTARISIRLKDPAPEAGAVVSLTSLDTGVLTVPASVTFSQGEIEKPFAPATTLSNGYRSGDVTATYSGDTVRTTVTVGPAAPDVAASNLVAPPVVDILQNFTASWTVTNHGEAPTNSYRQDTVYISPDDQLFNDGNDKVAGRFYDNNGILAPGQSKNVSFNQVNIPSNAIPLDGTYYLFIYVGDSGTVNERGGNYGDNFVSIPITVNRNLPDLVGENFVTPTEIEPGQLATFTWDVRNAGSAATTTGASVNAYFSFDGTIGNADDIPVTYRSVGLLAVNQTAPFSQQFVIPTTPVRPSGDAFFYLKVDEGNTVFEGNPTDAAELNNRPSHALRFEYRVPDLQVTAVNPPVEVESDTSFEVGWTTKNFGRKAAGPMYERVFFSTDQIVNANDVQIGEFQLNQTLDPDQSVDRVQNVSIPTNAITATGNYYIYVRTDAYGQVDEGANENNNVRFQQLRVRRLLRPDLRVTNITAPSSAFFDQEVQVQWTVTNNGTGPTNAANWQDELYLSTGANNSGPTFITRASNASALNPGESYITSVTVRIPRGFNGSYFFVVKTDSENRVNEELENNNLSSRPITVNIPPVPDLRTSNVQAPDQGFGGQPIAVGWTVTNNGTGATPTNESTWSDAIFLSRDAVFSGDDRYIGARQRSGVLAANGNYAVSGFSVNLPGDAFGDYYVFVVADYANQLYEFTAESNNGNYDTAAPGSPMHVLGTPPDLAVLNPITAPTSINAGQTANVQFVTRNQGAFDATGSWSDAVYISTDQVFDPQDDTIIASATHSGLVAGQQYVNNLTVTIPNCLNGTYYLFGVADVGNRIFEFDAGGNAETNNISQPKSIQISSFSPDLRVTQITVPPVVINGAMPISWTVKNFGTAATTQTSWTDRIFLINGNSYVNLGYFDHSGALPISGEYTQNQIVYIPLFLEGGFQIVVRTDAFNAVPECSYEVNNDDSRNTQVGQDLPDLRIAGVNSPGSAVLGTTFNVGWTGRNFSSAMTQQTTWADTVYLSSNATLDYGDQPIGGTVVRAMLGSNQSYNANANVTIPGVAPGSYYLLINSDNGNNVSEGVNENNNLSAVPISLTAPPVDLQVTNVTANPVLYSGQFSDISWTVTNTGTSPTATGSWTDYVILSRDLIIDPSDQVLEYRNHTGVLNGGVSYTETRSLQIPSGLTGEYKIIVVTDKNNYVAESNESNNASSPFTVDLQLPPPAELNITNIAPPANTVLGEDATFTWTIQNSSNNTANGAWQDSVYLSSDQTWDSGDILVGQKPHSGAVGAFATYTASLTTPMPAVETGSYYVLVRTDSRNAVRESNESNNVGTSLSQTNVSIANLTLGNALTTSLATSQERYYSILNVPADETMLISLDGQDGSRNELYSRQGSIVSRANYDVQGTNQGSADQENVVANTAADNYYTLARGDYVPNSFARELKNADDTRAAAQAVTIKAELLPFGVRTVSPGEAGNKGYTFLNIDGAKFQNGATVKMVGPGGIQLNPINTIYGGPTNVKALFALAGKPVGNYQVTLTNPNSQASTWSTNFQVKNGGGYDIRSEVIGAGEVRTGAYYRYTVTTRNQGTNDAVGVPVIIILSQPLNYRLSGSNRVDITTEGVDQSTVPIHFDADGKRFIFLYAPVIRSHESVNIGIDVQFGGPATITATTLSPLFSPNFVPASQRASRPGSQVDDLLFCYLDLLSKTLLTAFAEIFPADCAGAVISNVYGLMQTAFSATRTGFDFYSVMGSVLQSAVNVAVNCAKNLAKYIPWIKVLSLLKDLYDLSQLALECVKKTVEFVLRVDLTRAIDPNEKMGPVGFGPERWVAKEKPLLYRINFENKAEATAPAQKIRIVDQLPATLDPRTVKLVEMGFKQYRVEVPSPRAFYQTRLQLGTDLNNLKADISAGLDVTTGRVTWNFTAIDPQTNEQPLNPQAGLLPPNNASHDGEGYVIFSVQPNGSQPTRTDLANKATIYFDDNEPIATNTTTNLLDADIPVSQCSALPPTSVSPTIPMSWSGSDDANGSGLGSYDIYASENGGQYFPFLASTVDGGGTFNGNWGRSYRFYSVARDNAGNEEAAPAVPDASLTVLGGAYEGDVASRPNGNNDGTVNAQDVDQIRRFAAKLDTSFQYNEFQRADDAPRTNGGDGILSVADVVQASRYQFGSDPVANNAGPNEISTLSAKASGNSFAPGAVTPHFVSRTGNTVVVGIDIAAQGGETGVGFTMTYDPAVIANPTNIALDTDMAGGGLTANTTQSGKIGIVVDKSPVTPLAAGARHLLKIEFDVLATNNTAALVGFTSDIAKAEVADSNAAVVASSFVDTWTPILYQPTAAMTSVSGTARTVAGRPISGATITLTTENGTTRRALTNGLGLFQFTDVEAGTNVILAISHKVYHFAQPSMVITVDDAVENANFIADE